MITGIPLIFLIPFAIVLGLALGSFTTCVAYRVPRGLSIWRNDKQSSAYRSFCPKCETPLGARDLIPVLSWLLLKGRCRYCKQPIGTSYIAIELTVLIVVVFVVATYGFSITFLILCTMIPVLAAAGAFLVYKPRP